MSSRSNRSGQGPAGGGADKGDRPSQSTSGTPNKSRKRGASGSGGGSGIGKHVGGPIWLLKLLSEVPASWLSGVRRYISENL